MDQRQIEILPIDTLNPYERNSRTHSAAQIKQIEASIKEFGFINPILVDANLGIMAGHGRFLAAQKMRMETVPCLRIDHLTEKQKRAYIIADNKLAENAGWDQELLFLELGELIDMDFDFDLLGFKQDEIDTLFKEFEDLSINENEDDIPEEPIPSITKEGDLWRLGNHRIICGNAEDEKVVEILLDGARPHLMVTDPPYGVKYDASWRKNIHGSKKNLATGKVLNDDNADWRKVWRLFPGDVAYIWHASTFTNVVADSLIASGFELRSEIIWAKGQLVISRGNYHPQHEPCWYAVRKGKKSHWNGSRKKTTLWKDISDIVRDGENVFIHKDEAEILYAISGSHTTVWDIPKPLKNETGHSTQKPVECMRRPILNNSKSGDSIYEPFSGSGTTIIAAEQTGRACYAIELSPTYVDIAIKRWENFTGQKAELLTENNCILKS